MWVYDGVFVNGLKWVQKWVQKWVFGCRGALRAGPWGGAGFDGEEVSCDFSGSVRRFLGSGIYRQEFLTSGA